MSEGEREWERERAREREREREGGRERERIREREKEREREIIGSDTPQRGVQGVALDVLVTGCPVTSYT